MASDGDKNYDDVRNTSRNMFAFVHSMCEQAQKEMDTIDSTTFDQIAANFYCGKSLWFIEFIRSSLATYWDHLVDVKNRLTLPTNAEPLAKPVADAARKSNRNRLSLRQFSEEAETVDTFFNTEASSQKETPSDLPKRETENSADEKTLSFNYPNLTQNGVPSCSSGDEFECERIKTTLPFFKDEPDDYEMFEDKKAIDAVLDKLLGDLISADKSKNEAHARGKPADDNPVAPDDDLKGEEDGCLKLAEGGELCEGRGTVLEEDGAPGNDCDLSFKEVNCEKDERVTGTGDSDMIDVCLTSISPAECEEDAVKDESEEEVSLEQRRRDMLEAVRELEDIGYNTSDLASSSDADSVESESDEDVPMRKNRNAQEGKEVLIETDVFLDIIDSEPAEPVPSISSFDERRCYDEFNLRECSVVLRDLTGQLLKKRSTCEEELAEIERLTNLTSLNRKTRRASGDDEKAKKTKRRRISSVGKSSVDSDETDVDRDSPDYNRTSSEPVKIEALEPKIDSEKIMQEILNYGFDDDTDDSNREVNSGDETDEFPKTETDSDVSVVEKPIVKSDKEDEEEEEEEGATDNIKENHVDPELLKRKKWRRDGLLTGKITDSSSSDDEDGGREKNRSGKSAEGRGEATGRKHNDVEFVGVTQLNGVNPIALSSDSENSDVEFVKVLYSKRRRKKGGKEDDDEVKKGGRRNIRAVKSDEALEEATKLAAKEEDDRARRILRKQKNLDDALSQASTEILHGLVLDVDEETNEAIVSVNLQLTNKLKSHQREGVRFMWNTCYESVNRLKDCEGTGCILAHCMGLGKTLQVVTLVHTLFAHPVTNTRHVLIVCPLSTVLNWEYEFKIGLDDLYEEGKKPVRRFIISNRTRDKEYRVNVIEDWLSGSGVLVLGYEAYQTLVKLVPEVKWAVLTEKQQHVKEALIDPGPDLVICDEGHLLKNGNNNRTKSLMKIKTKRRIILTGTPLQNNLIEYYYMVKFVKPNLLGTLTEYSNRFVNPITNGQYDDSTPADIQLMRKRSHVLHKILNRTVQRYEVTELKNYLPEMTDYVVNVLLHPVQVELYKTYLESVCSEGRGGKRLFYDFNNLRTVWTHPYLIYLVEQHKAQFDKKSKLEVDTINLESNEITVVSDQVGDDAPVKNYCGTGDELPRGWWQKFCPEDFKTNVDYGPKFKVLFGILEACEEVGDKVLVFSNSLAELDCIEYFLKTMGTSARPSWRRKEHYLRMDGTVPPDTRMRYCNYFNDPANTDVRVFLISHRVGGLGLNLVAANRVVLMDVNFNPAYDLQSIFRIYRFGQKKHCYVYRLMAKGTMEEVNYERSVTKLAVAGRVVDQLQIPRHYKSSDLQKMYRFKIFTKDSIQPYGIPSDEVLRRVLQNFNAVIHSFHEHQSLLENLTEEVLNETEMKKAWEEFNEEKLFKRWDKDSRVQAQPEHSQGGSLGKGATAVKGPDNKEHQHGVPMNPFLLERMRLSAHSNLKVYKLTAPLNYSWSRRFVCSANSSSSAQANDSATDKAACNKESVTTEQQQQASKSQDKDAAPPKQFKSAAPDRNRTIALPSAEPKNTASESKQKENVPAVIDLEREDLLKQISCNDSLTLSTVLVESLNKDPVSEISYENVIEID